MVWKRPKAEAPSPLTRRQQLLSTVIALVVGFIVMAATRNVIWGFVTFMVFGIIVNAIVLARQKK